MPKDGTATRTRILDAAEQLVIENGYAATSVDQVLQSVATIEPVTQAAVAFPIAGTVESVAVAVGDRAGL